MDYRMAHPLLNLAGFHLPLTGWVCPPLDSAMIHWVAPCRLVLLESSKKPILTGPRATRLFKSAKLIVRYLNLKRLRVAGFKAPRDTKGSGSRAAWLTMVFKLALAAEKRWRRLNGNALLADVIRGVRFVDGIKELAP